MIFRVYVNLPKGIWNTTKSLILRSLNPHFILRGTGGDKLRLNKHSAHLHGALDSLDSVDVSHKNGDDWGMVNMTLFYPHSHGVLKSDSRMDIIRSSILNMGWWKHPEAAPLRSPYFPILNLSQHSMPLWHHIPALCLDFVWNMETKIGKMWNSRLQSRKKHPQHWHHAGVTWVKGISRGL